MFKIIVSDLDGTLLNSNGIITNYTSETIKSLINNEIKFIIATGRHYLDAVNICKKNNINTFLITANGSVAHNDKNELIFYKKIDGDILLKIIENVYLNEDVYTNIFCYDLWITNPTSKLNRIYVKKYNYNELLSDKNILNNSCKIHFNSENINYLINLKKILNKDFENYIDVNFSLPFCLEVNPKNVSKGNTLKFILKNLGYSLKECISFGDGMNDYNMLSITGKACLMKNSSEELKNNLPNLEIIDSNNNDGVAKYIKSNILNNN